MGDSSCVALAVAATTVIPELLLLASALLTAMIVAVVALSVQLMAPTLVGEMSQLAFGAHALW